MANSRQCRRRCTIALCGAFVIGLLLGGCGRRSDSQGLVWQLTHLDEYHPPESASRDTARYFPTLYVRAERDSLMGIVNPNPLEPFRDVAEAPGRDLITQLRFSRQVLQERAGDSVRVPFDANLVLDRKMNFGQVMEAVYITNYGTFRVPHLITASGHEHVVEPPRIHREFGPVGWSAWVWWMPDQSVKWMAWPDSSQRMVMRTLPSRDGAADIPALLDSLHQALDGKEYIPPGSDRLIGVWAYDGLTYPELMRFMDEIRYPKKGIQLAARITLLQGENWSPPELPPVE